MFLSKIKINATEPLSKLTNIIQLRKYTLEGSLSLKSGILVILLTLDVLTYFYDIVIMICGRINWIGNRL